MQNIIYRNYDSLKPKQKKRERNFSYHNQMLCQLAQIVRVDDFKELLDLDLDVAINIKLTEGMVGITKVLNTYYLVYAIAPAGMPRKDGRPFQVTGTYIDSEQRVQTKTFTNDVDIVIWYNNALGTPESNIDYFSYCFTETDTSIEYNLQHSRFNPFIKVKSEKQKRQYVQAMTDTHDGKPIVIVDEDVNPFSDGNDNNLTVNLTDVKESDKLQYLSLLFDHFTSRYASLYGFSMSNNGTKLAQMTEAEVNGTTAYSWLLPIDMLEQAKQFCERLSTLYSVELNAHFGTLHEFNFSKFTTTCTADDISMNEDICKDEELQELQEDGTESKKNSEEDSKRDESEEDKKDLMEDDEDAND